MNVLLLLLLAQAINLVVFVWFNRETAVRLALYRQQLAVYQRSYEKAEVEGQGSDVLGLTFKALERLEIRVACGQA